MNISKSKFRFWVNIVIVVVLIIAFLSALQIFNGKPYIIDSVGDSVHYVPRDRNPSVPLKDFPTVPPGPGQKITPKGKIVKIN